MVRVQSASMSSNQAIQTQIAGLFQRLPMLAGFSVRDDLEVADVAVYSWPGYVAGQDLYDDLMEALVDLAEEQPGAIDVLRGRTFARALH